MRKVLMIMFMTLDGVAEFPEYGEDRLSESDHEDPMWTHRMQTIDTLLLGRKTYEKWAAYWPARKTDPKSSTFQREFSLFADRTNKVVFSKSLTAAEWPNSRVARDPEDEVTRLKALPGKDMALGGGPRLAQFFLERSLVDEILIEVFPSIVGGGKPLFRVASTPDNPEDFIPLGAPGRHDFKLLESKGEGDGSVFLHYSRDVSAT